MDKIGKYITIFYFADSILSISSLTMERENEILFSLHIVLWTNREIWKISYFVDSILSISSLTMDRENDIL